MALLEDVQDAIQRVSGTAGPAVVGIGQRWGVGSGVIVGEGRIVTNAHNVRRDEVTVTLPDGSTTTGRVGGVDVDRDLAVVTVDGNGVAGIEWAPAPSELGIGATVFALSNPGGRGLRVTFGFVSGTERSFRGPRGRRIAGSVEHTAPLLPGSSGGPIVDSEGRFLGLNTNRLGEGFYLAIPADDSLRTSTESLGRGESPSRARLGVGIAPPHVARGLRRAVGLDERDGLLVRAVEEESPAEVAGIKDGDLLIEANGRPLTDFDSLYNALDAAAGTRLEIKLVRGVEEVTVSVDLG
jgi:serine protease Do